MAIAKAKFERLNGRLAAVGDAIEVSFNPNELTYNKGVQLSEIAIPGLDSPILQFVRGQAETLAVDLFFDSTDEGGTGAGAVSVTTHTDQFYKLIKIDRATHAPPVCRFVWGKGLPSSNIIGASSTQAHGTFQCVVESVRQKFSLFSAEGVPLRATLSLSLKEYKTLEDQVTEIGKESADHTHARVVQRGDTVTSIAAEAYDDPAPWRAIALHNDIDDPLDLEVGTILEVPALR
ncbi:MAG: hypothetical protein QOC81_1068 [Thermoanaerobaculia bacterium]|jgi:hypothetical protein|nr:hypothetical protein [Thermoanaerobaculia bacterium]